MPFLLDSSVLIEVERLGQMPDLIRNYYDEAIGLSVITISELLMGVHRGQGDERRTKRQAFLDSVLESFEVFPFDIETANVHSTIWAALMAAGNLIGPHDMIIAATAMTRGYGVVTRNVREFEHVTGLEVREPPW